MISLHLKVKKIYLFFTLMFENSRARVNWHLKSSFWTNTNGTFSGVFALSSAKILAVYERVPFFI